MPSDDWIRAVVCILALYECAWSSRKTHPPVLIVFTIHISMLMGFPCGAKKACVILSAFIVFFRDTVNNGQKWFLNLRISGYTILSAHVCFLLIIF